MEPPDASLRRRWASASVDLFGLRLPIRETVVISVTTFALLIGYYHNLLFWRLPGLEDWLIAQSVLRALLYGVIPLAALLLMGERPSEYGLRIGDWRVGSLVILGVAVALTPVILAVAGLSDFAFYYDEGRLDVMRLTTISVLDVGSAEFLFRGFLMFALVRRVGPLGVLLAAVPFVFSHQGKPELETLSTLVGGLGFGWLAWRTESVLYGAVLHIYLLTLIRVLAAS